MNMEYQIYGLDVNGSCTHAGCHEMKRFSKREALRIQREWERWRDEYLASHPGDYPLRTDNRKTVKLWVYPITDHSKSKIFNLY